MPLMRTPGARVAVLTPSSVVWQRTNDVLAHDLTTVRHYATISDMMSAERPDIVVVDRALLSDGAMILRRLRKQWLTCTLIVTNARCERDCEQLLDIGADDVSPIGDLLLPARLRAAARRARAMNASMRIAIGDIVYDRESRRVWCADHEVRLSRTEEALLDCLFWYAPRAVSIEDLTAFAWRTSGHAQRSNLVHVYMGYLRKKLRESREVVIQTVRGVGYEFASRDSIAD